MGLIAFVLGMLGYGVALSVEVLFGIPHAAVYESFSDLIDLSSVAVVQLLNHISSLGKWDLMWDIYKQNLPFIGVMTLVWVGFTAFVWWWHKTVQIPLDSVPTLAPASVPTSLRRQGMFNHVMVGSNDLERSERFYSAVLAVLGVAAPFRSTAASGHVRLFYRHNGGTLGVTQPINSEPATSANGGTIAFRCDSPEQVHAFHDTAVASGGTSIEDPPGLRNAAGGTYYLAYVRDPDGNKLCAIHRMPS